MVSFYGDYDTTETVNIPFNTFSSNDPAASVTVTDLAAGDIEIHKDGGTTQRSSDAGVTVSINFDTVTGNHMVHIDLSDNTDAGFYANGSRYQVRLEGITVDGGTLNVWIGSFSIGCTLRPTTAGRTLDIQSTGEVDANLTMIGADGQSATDLKDFADAGYDPATNKVQGVVLTDTCTTNTDLVSAADVVNEWETQSQADPTGFHVNVKEVNGTAQTANDNSADINTLITQIGTAGAGLTDLGGMSTAMKAEVEAEANDALEALNLDHLCKVADADDVVNNSIIAKMVSSAATADWSGFVNTTDSLQAMRDHIGDGTNLTEAGGDGDHLTAINLPNQTMDITGDITGNLSGSVGSVTGNVGGNVVGSVGSLTGHTVQTGDSYARLGAPAGASIAADIAAVPDAAAINAEVVDALATDTYGEPAQGAPGATVTLAYKLGFLYKLARNKIDDDGTTVNLYNDDASTVDHKATVSYATGTATRGEFATGP